MTLGDQLRAVTGREIEVFWEHKLQAQIGIQSAKEWRAYLRRAIVKGLEACAELRRLILAKGREELRATKRSPRTPTQREAQAAKMRAYWAAKNAAATSDKSSPFFATAFRAAGFSSSARKRPVPLLSNSSPLPVSLQKPKATRELGCDPFAAPEGC